jgi:ABC-2 type transport system ATP-binding protein
MQKSVIVENLSKNYFKKEAVKEISFTINENEILGLLGPNGCGKTTTIAMMLGLLKPSNGKVVIHGLDIEKNRISLLHKMNFISPYIELPKKLSVKENLIVYGKLYGVKFISDRIKYLSEKLRLEEFINKKTGELSSGQKNRVSLAKALINEPSILFLDEPTASLDPETGDFVRSFIEKISREKKMSILLASHNMDEVKRLCKNVLMMNNGVIIDKGTPDDLIKKHGKRNLEEVFLKLNRNNHELK